MMRVKALSCLIVLLAFMAACGGGGCNPCEPEQKLPSADCQARPEACK